MIGDLVQLSALAHPALCIIFNYGTVKDWLIHMPQDRNISGIKTCSAIWHMRFSPNGVCQLFQLYFFIFLCFLMNHDLASSNTCSLGEKYTSSRVPADLDTLCTRLILRHKPSICSWQVGK